MTKITKKIDNFGHFGAILNKLEKVIRTSTPSNETFYLNIQLVFFYTIHGNIQIKSFYLSNITYGNIYIKSFNLANIMQIEVIIASG